MNLERRVISLRRGDVCCHCGKDLPSGFRALWDFYSRTITCLACAEPGEALEATSNPPKVL